MFVEEGRFALDWPVAVSADSSHVAAVWPAPAPDYGFRLGIWSRAGVALGSQAWKQHIYSAAITDDGSVTVAAEDGLYNVDSNLDRRTKNQTHSVKLAGVSDMTCARLPDGSVGVLTGRSGRAGQSASLTLLQSSSDAEHSTLELLRPDMNVRELGVVGIVPVPATAGLVAWAETDRGFWTAVVDRRAGPDVVFSGFLPIGTGVPIAWDPPTRSLLLLDPEHVVRRFDGVDVCIVNSGTVIAPAHDPTARGAYVGMGGGMLDAI